MKIQLIKASKNRNSHVSDEYLFCTQNSDLDKIVSGAYLELPFLENKEIREFILYQNKLIDSLREYNNKNEVFLSSPLGCENTWQSDFFVSFENFFRLKKILKEKKNIKIIFYDHIWYLIVLKFLKTLPGCKIVHSQSDLIGCYFCSIKLYMSKTYRLYHAFRNIIKLSMPLSKNLKIINDKHRIIFLSVWSESVLQSFLKNNVDPYFSNVPYLLISREVVPAIFCHVNNFDNKYLSEFDKIKTLKVYSYFNFLSLVDLLSILKKLFFHKVKIPMKYRWLKPAIKGDLEKKIWIQSCQALMVKYSLVKFLRSNPGAKIVHMYEGNCWEKGCVMASQQSNKSSVVIGYQHTGLSISQQKLRNSNLLMPDMILTTGDIAKKILVDEFKHSKEKVISTCALRHEFIYKYPPKKIFPKTIKKVLVLLQGSPFDCKLIKWVSDIQNKFFFDISVRQHPAYIIPGIESMFDVKISNEVSIQKDILGCDLVIYHGTTAALEAVFLGVPCIFVDIGVSGFSDPLFQIQNNVLVLKLSQNDSFKELLRNIPSRRNSYQKDLFDIRTYFSNYFEQASETKKNQLIDIILEVSW